MAIRGRISIASFYYYATPVFILLDYFGGVNVRVAGSVAGVPPAIRRQDAFGTARSGCPIRLYSLHRRDAKLCRHSLLEQEDL